MALSSYAELNAALAVLLNRDDLTDSIPDFIRLCETDVDARPDLAKHRRRICRASAIISNEYELSPQNFLAVQTIDLADPAVSLARVDPDNITRMKHDEARWRQKLAAELCVGVAPPAFYTVVGTEFRFFPAPQQSYTAQLNVYERLPPLATYDTNWALQFYPSIYLYGAALHSAPFLKDDARIAVWSGLYEKTCEMAALADPFETDRSKLRTDLVGLTNRWDGRSFFGMGLI